MADSTPADRAAPLAEGDRIELSVIPDRYVTVRYAGASGDFNPIHIDEQFALEVGLPGRILHGLWSMAQMARAVGDATVKLDAVQGSTKVIKGAVAQVRVP